MPIESHALLKIVASTTKGMELLDEARMLLIRAEQETPFGHPAKAILTEQWRYLFGPKDDELFLSATRVLNALIKQNE